MRALPLALLLVLAGHLQARPELQVFLENRTGEPVCVETTMGTIHDPHLPENQPPVPNAGGFIHPAGGEPRHDLGCRYMVPAGGRINFLRFTELRSYVDREFHWYLTDVRFSSGSRLTLEQKLDLGSRGFSLYYRAGEASWIESPNSWKEGGGEMTWFPEGEHRFFPVQFRVPRNYVLEYVLGPPVSQLGAQGQEPGMEAQPEVLGFGDLGRSE